MEQETQHPPDSRVWDDQATPGERRRAALRKAGRLRTSAEINRWLAAK